MKGKIKEVKKNEEEIAEACNMEVVGTTQVISDGKWLNGFEIKSLLIQIRRKKFDILLLNTRQYSQRVKAIEKPIQAPFTKRCEDIFCKNKNKLIFYGFIFYTLILLVLLIKVGW